MAAPTRAERNTEIIRLKKLASKLHVLKVDHYFGETSILYDVWVKDDRLPPDNEGMSVVSADAKVARVTVRPGKWIRYEPGSGGAGTYGDSTAIFTAAAGGGCTGF
jgi:hypothetical protein